MKKRKGFTLAELMSAIILMALLGTILGTIIHTMFKSHVLIDREASIQAEMRATMQIVDNSVQRSTAIFVLDDSKFDGTDQRLTEGWNYIGLSDDGKKIVNYLWNKDTNKWDRKELGVVSLHDIKLDIEFKPEADYDNNRVIKYELKGQYQDTGSRLDLNTAVMAVNTKQIFSKVANGKKGVAIAYRTDPIEGIPSIAVSFVFDTSGSMFGDMKGEHYNSPTKGPSRMSILKDKAKIMVDNLVTYEVVNINLVHFSDLGGYIHRDFITLNSAPNVALAKKQIDKLPNDGYTNPGDGLRHSFVSLQKSNAQLKYIILLTDGVPNKHTLRDGKFDLTSLVGADASKESVISKKPTENALEYTRRVSQTFAPTFSPNIRRVSVIGFSGVAADKVEGEALTKAIKNTSINAEYYDAESEERLQEVFDGIRKQIEQDLWFVVGP